MADVHDRETRSRNMAAIKGKNTKPEVWLRKELFRLGFRYRLHPGNLPGKPDLILPKYNAAIFVHGCFWHGHDCHLFRLPASRQDFWKAKIESNKQRDTRNREALSADGWRVLEVWECAMKGRERRATDEILSLITDWIRGGSPFLSIRGTANPEC